MELREQVRAEAEALMSRLQEEKAATIGKAHQMLRQALEAAVEAEAAAATPPAALDAQIVALAESVERMCNERVHAAERATLALEQALEAARAEVISAQEERGRWLQEREQWEEERGQWQEERTRAQEESARLAAQLEEVKAELDQAEDEHLRAQTLSQQSALAPLDLLLESMRRFAGATTVVDVLTVLVESFAQDLGRAALFSVQGGRLEGVRQVGLEFASDVSKLVVPLGMDSVLSDAVSSGRVQGLLGPGLTARTRAMFGGAPGFALVVPVVIKGEPLALLYADDAGAPPNEAVRPEQHMKLAELLLCQAVPRLPALLRSERAIAEHAGQTRKLLEQVEQGYVLEREEGIAASELSTRLGRRLKEARDIYERATGGSRDAMAIFAEQVAQLVRRHSGSPLGRDLAACSKGIVDLSLFQGHEASAARA